MAKSDAGEARWTCVAGHDIVHLAFGPTPQEYSVLAGSIMTDAAHDAIRSYPNFDDVDVERVLSIFEATSCGTWRSTECILFNSPVEAASFFMGEEAMHATWRDQYGVETAVGHLSPSRRWTPDAAATADSN